jgi:putative heme iron utilization protein
MAHVKIPLYQSVALREDIDEHHLKRGDVAVVVDYVPHPVDGEDGYVLEVFNALGESLNEIVVRESKVEALHSDQVLSVRQETQTL